MLKTSVVLLNSITDLRAEHVGSVAISGSHGGLYPASVASRGGLHAVVFNDAGIGLNRAGVAGVAFLESLGMAAVATSYMSCEIGSAEDTLMSGKVSVANGPAAALGVEVGMSISEAVDNLCVALRPDGQMDEVVEARQTQRLESGLVVTLLDSASLVVSDDVGRVIVTGSHGGLIGGDVKRALKAPARIAVFNDAGIGRNGIGVTRLPALEAQGVAALTVSNETAEIGNALSALRSGRISRCNATAAGLGAIEGLPLRDWLETLPVL